MPSVLVSHTLSKAGGSNPADIELTNKVVPDRYSTDTLHSARYRFAIVDALARPILPSTSLPRPACSAPLRTSQLSLLNLLPRLSLLRRARQPVPAEMDEVASLDLYVDRPDAASQDDGDERYETGPSELGGSVEAAQRFAMSVRARTQGRGVRGRERVPERQAVLGKIERGL